MAASVGPAVIAIVAALIAIFLGGFWLRKRELGWNGWGALIAVATGIYAAAVFVQYNVPAGPASYRAELVQFTGIALLIHALYGYAWARAGRPARRYHLIAGSFHALVVMVLWTTDLLFRHEFVAREFAWLDRPYVEPVAAPLGTAFMAYAAIAAVVCVVLYLRHGSTEVPGGNVRFLLGMGLWAAFGAHDALATVGMPTVMFLMEYGFLAFTLALLWNSLEEFTHLYDRVEAREERLAAEKDRLAVTLRSIADGVIATDIDDRVVLINRAARELCGVTEAEALGRPLTQLIPPPPSAGEGVIDPTRDGPAAGPRVTGVLTGPDGSERLVSESRWPIHDREGRAIGTVLIVRDVTERAELEERISRLQKMEAIGLLAGGVAHDLNNVLTVLIHGPGLVMQMLPPDSPEREELALVKETAERAAGIVADMLLLARRNLPSSEIFAPNELLAHACAAPQLRRILDQRPEVSLEVRPGDGIANLQGSTLQFSKAVMNLVLNAVEAISGAGEVVVASRGVELEVTHDGYESVPPGAYVVIEVTDDGQGIERRHLGKLFEPFFTRKKLGRSGTGLGMTVVWSAVKDHGGFVDVVSEAGAGSRISLYFPVYGDEGSVEAADWSMTDFIGSGESVLVVDDVPHQRELACRMLERLKYTAVPAASGEEAVAYLAETHADLVLLDMIMDPGIDGLETLRRLRGAKPDQRVVLFSGYSEPERLRAAMALGVGTLLRKPYSFEQLACAVRDALTG